MSAPCSTEVRVDPASLGHGTGEEEWLAESLRLTVFPLVPDARQHWEALLSTPPESIIRPPQVPSQVIEEGPWGKDRLQIDAQPGQIHWRVLPTAQNPDNVMVIGAFSSATPPFGELMKKVACYPLS